MNCVKTFEELFQKDYETGKINEKRVVDFLNNNTCYKKKYVFWYLYKDGLYYYDFDIDDINNKIIFLDWWKRTTRGKLEQKKVFYIPHRLLTLFSDEITF
jgi:hypothetical protein